MKKVFFGLILVVLMVTPVAIYRHFDNKKVEGVQDINSKIISSPKESDRKTQPSISPSQSSVQNSSANSPNVSKRTYIQNEIDKLEQNRKANLNAIKQIGQALSNCPEGNFDWCNNRRKQDTEKYYDSITEIDKQIQEWKIKLVDTY